MAITFGALLYFQIMYLENIVKMRKSQFTESVMRSLYGTASFLERMETLHYLQEDASQLLPDYTDEFTEEEMQSGIYIPEDNKSLSPDSFRISLTFPSPTENVGTRFRELQEILRSRYLYQQGMLNEVILMILHEASTRPPIERADSAIVRECLTNELKNNGLSVPFTFALCKTDGSRIYSTSGFNPENEKNAYSIELFANSGSGYILEVDFPTKENYIFSSVRFIIPTLALTAILLVVFILTIVIVFRQKKLSEMKADFINNMTHELKTPISTISLAGQMLSDDSVRKSPSTLKHISDIISDESKRLRFQVDKVLQMSVLDNSAIALNFTEADANSIISNVVNTFKIKVERYGGKLEMNLDATKSIVNVDEMQFTNVVFNLLDNAVKYRDPEREPLLSVSTRDVDKKIEITVKDNGIGIKKEDLKRIFEKFYRVSTGNLHDVKGFGLGLAYVRKMVEAFHGSISVTSEPGAGTEFSILLPLSE